MLRHIRNSLYILVIAIVLIMGTQVPNRVLANSIMGITLTPTAANTFTPSPPTATNAPPAKTAQPEQMAATATPLPTATQQPVIPPTGDGASTNSILGILLAALGIVVIIVAAFVILRGRKITHYRQ